MIFGHFPKSKLSSKRKYVTPGKCKISQHEQKVVPEQQFPKCSEQQQQVQKLLTRTRDSFCHITLWSRPPRCLRPGVNKDVFIDEQMYYVNIAFIWAFPVLQCLTDTLKALFSFYKRNN